MNIAVYIGVDDHVSDPRVVSLMNELEKGGCRTYPVSSPQDLVEGTDMLMSIAGDGTFLRAATMVFSRHIPVVGVNLGRMGFLSENRPEDVAGALPAEDYTIETRAMLKAEVCTGSREIDEFPFALNEMSVRRCGAAMLCVDVCIDGIKLPAYWGDGLVISTSSGSTAYSLSVGGPIALPESKVFIISPIAPHNLNMRPLVVPYTSEITLAMHTRDGSFEFSADNRTAVVPADTSVTIGVAQFSLNRVRLNTSNFIQALTEKLYWGEDVRNIR